MSHKRLWVAASIIALFVFITFMFSVPHTRDVGVKSPFPSNAPIVPVVTVHDAFKKGLHTITGSIEVPNACALVSAEASIASNASSTESILVAISVHTDTNVCLQLPTRATFQTSISAPASLPFIVTVNGTPATVNAP